MEEQTKADYDQLCEDIAVENMALELKDRDRHLHESVNFSEWTFKTNLADKVMEFTQHKDPDGPYMAMMNDVRTEIKRLEREAQEDNTPLDLKDIAYIRLNWFPMFEGDFYHANECKRHEVENCQACAHNAVERLNK